MKDVSGKVALVTGAAGGIGLGMAQAFAGAGMKVALADLDDTVLASAVESFADSRRVMGIRLDVADPTAWEVAVDEIGRTFGPVQILCNNAGVTTPTFPINDCSFEQQAIEDWRWALDVNLSGTFFGIRTVLGHLRRSGLDGHFVNTSSMAGIIPFPGNPPAYTASKFGILGLSELLRIDLRRKGPSNVGASILFPGHTRSRINDTSAALSPSGGGRLEESEFMRGVRERNATGTDPRLVGERVLRAIRSDEFYIFSHPEYRDRVHRHYQELLGSFADPADPTRVDQMPKEF